MLSHAQAAPPGATVPRPGLQDCPRGPQARCWLPWAPSTGCAPQKGECGRSGALAWPWEAAAPCQWLPGFGDGGSSSRGALLVAWRLLRVPLVHEHRSVPLRGAVPPAPRVLLCWCRCVQRLREQGLAGAVHSGLPPLLVPAVPQERGAHSRVVHKAAGMGPSAWGRPAWLPGQSSLGRQGRAGR